MRSFAFWFGVLIWLIDAWLIVFPLPVKPGRSLWCGIAGPVFSLLVITFSLLQYRRQMNRLKKVLAYKASIDKLKIWFKENR